MYAKFDTNMLKSSNKSSISRSCCGSIDFAILYAKNQQTIHLFFFLAVFISTKQSKTNNKYINEWVSREILWKLSMFSSSSLIEQSKQRSKTCTVWFCASQTHTNIQFQLIFFVRLFVIFKQKFNQVLVRHYTHSQNRYSIIYLFNNQFSHLSPWLFSKCLNDICWLNFFSGCSYCRVPHFMVQGRCRCQWWAMTMDAVNNSSELLPIASQIHANF